MNRVRLRKGLAPVFTGLFLSVRGSVSDRRKINQARKGVHMKRIPVALLVIVSTIVLVLAACGGGYRRRVQHTNHH